MNEITRIAILPRDDRTNGWSGTLPGRSPGAALAGEQKADWIVLGAGWAGLAAARRLAVNRPNDRIVLVEAGTAGEG
ncbi:MAG: FAD-dependent oxidoreductase, partial [Proteobacteria bacterium]|nr:FAD-dependent oxidoreductase [Pseudomonadota bacterium]